MVSLHLLRCSCIFKPDYEYAKEAALITEEILRQRIKGVKNEADVYITPAFPK